jgi:hypothetical protein
VGVGAPQATDPRIEVELLEGFGGGRSAAMGPQKSSVAVLYQA